MSIQPNQLKLTPDQLPLSGYSRASQLLPFLPFGKTILYTWSKDGRFIKPVKIGSMTCWSNASVHDWFAAQGKTVQPIAVNDGGVNHDL